MFKQNICRNKGFTLVELLAAMALLAMISLMIMVIFNQSTKVWKKADARTQTYIAARSILDQMAREIKGAVLVGTYGFSGPSTGGIGQMGLVVLHATDDTENQLQGWRTTGPGASDPREQPYSDQIYFIAPVENSGRQTYCLIGYWVRDPERNTTGAYDDDSRTPQDMEGYSDDSLYRYFVTDNSGNWRNMNFGDGDGATGSNEFALNVKSLRIRCWSDDPNESDFTTEWEDTSGTPSTGQESKVNWDTLVGGLTAGTYDDNRLPKAVKITIVVQDENAIEKEREFSTIVTLDNATR